MKNKEKVEKLSKEKGIKEISKDEFDSVMKKILSAPPKKKKEKPVFSEKGE